MTDKDKNDLKHFAERLKGMDDAGRDTVRIVIDALYARSKFGEKRDERREKEGSVDKRTEGTPSEL